LLKKKTPLELPLRWLVGRGVPHFIGMEDREKITSYVKHFSPVPYFESLSVMRAADVLLTVEAPLKKSIFFPSKLVDYLGARKPMLAITPKGSLTAHLMDEWKQPWCDVADADAIAAAIERAASGQLWAAPPVEILQKYSAKTGAKELADLFRATATASV
jgi:hypothetical protein